jgi:hypothetical protein
MVGLYGLVSSCMEEKNGTVPVILELEWHLDVFRCFLGDIVPCHYLNHCDEVYDVMNKSNTLSYKRVTDWQDFSEFRLLNIHFATSLKRHQRSNGVTRTVLHR